MLTVAVVQQLLDSWAGASAGRLVASVVGALMVLEGAMVLLMSTAFSGAEKISTAANGLAMVVAGAGIWGIAYRSLWSHVSTGKSR